VPAVHDVVSLPRREGDGPLHGCARVVPQRQVGQPQAVGGRVQPVGQVAAVGLAATITAFVAG
jgi:hypothetical protein